MPSSSSPEPEDHRSGRVKRRGRRASKSGGEGVSDLIDQSSDYGDEDLGFNCGGQQPGCGVFNSENIFARWPDLKHIPRPEPLKNTLSHERWKEEYDEWSNLRCGQGLGYFCRMHAIWVSCSEVRAQTAPTREQQLLEKCPESHYIRDQAITQSGHACQREREAARAVLLQERQQGPLQANIQAPDSPKV
ncbi:hypothetical protein QBC42DRAFT_274352 [Cladorrhinum samala]|uniref:Uncharacterized protein n=1 Tax=Cladorrhinum samala TaxID=585594 RepID=A0AAV9HEW4_9PEZI|nr:hypothetical protein QBC42DRAFT_274352 [Cladorrhinum samala]